MWGMVVTSTFDLLWPYPTCQHTGPRIVCNVGGRLVPHRNRREKFVFRRQSERAQAEFVGRLGRVLLSAVSIQFNPVCCLHSFENQITNTGTTMTTMTSTKKLQLATLT